MCADRSRHPIVHFVGSIPLPDSEIVFRTLSSAVGPHLKRVPDGETGIRKTWIRFLQEVLAQNPAIEVASDVPPFKFVQWDGKLLREIPRLRLKPGAKPDAAQFATGYADMAIQSWAVFERLQKAGVIPAKVKFQICIPTPIAPTYNNMVPGDRPALLPALTQHFIGEVAKIASALPNDRIALQWDVCQEVLAWEGYYEKGPVDFRTETLSVLKTIGDAVPAGIELGYHLCYGSPADEHCVQPKDAGIMVEMTNAITAGVKRPIQFFHMPVPKGRTDDAYYVPLETLKLGRDTELYLGLIHHDDAKGDATRLAAARRHARVDGVATECGMARGDPCRASARRRNRALGRCPTGTHRPAPRACSMRRRRRHVMHYVQLRVRRGLGTDDTQLDSFRTFAWTCAPCCLLLLMLAFPALAADPDPIDAALDACLAKPEGSSTVGMVECTGDAIRAWDKRLNEVYQLVMAGLDPKSQELLRASQRRWVAFREAEHEAMGGPWQQNRGTIIRVLTASTDLSAIKERVQELQLYGPDGG